MSKKQFIIWSIWVFSIGLFSLRLSSHQVDDKSLIGLQPKCQITKTISARNIVFNCREGFDEYMRLCHVTHVRAKNWGKCVIHNRKRIIG